MMMHVTGGLEYEGAICPLLIPWEETMLRRRRKVPLESSVEQEINRRKRLKSSENDSITIDYGNFT